MRLWRWGARNSLAVGLAAVCAVGCGTTYMRNRGRDAMQMIDWGVVTSSKPCFGLTNDYFNVLPLGYTNVQGTFHGLGNCKCGSMPFQYHLWGALFWGSLKFQLDEFDPNSPFQFSPEKIAALAAGTPLPTEARRYNLGFVRISAQDNAPPPRTGFM